jgi:hypothetical protein
MKMKVPLVLLSSIGNVNECPAAGKLTNVV